MNNPLEQHPVDEYLNNQQSRISEFSKNHAPIWKIFATCFDISRILMVAIGEHSPTQVETHRLLMWQSVTEYQVQSLILILSGRLNSGYAMLRLATELSRDVNCIGDDESRLTLWLNKEKQNKEYRTVFKFDDSNPTSKMAHSFYKLCSEFGVHGHLTDSAVSEPVGIFGQNDSLLLLAVPESEILRAVYIWLEAFMTIQDLCASTFFERHLVELYDPILEFGAFGVVLGEILGEVGKSFGDSGEKS